MGGCRVIHGVTLSSAGHPSRVRRTPPSRASDGPASAAARRAPRAARLAAALAGLVAIGAYLFVALSRLDYPFAARVAGGQLARRGAPHPGRPAAVPGADRRVRPRRVPAALLLRVGRRRPACSASRTCRCGWCPWCPRSPASRCSPAWSSARRGASRPGPAPRACSPRPTSPRAPGSTSAGSTRCSSRSASAACTRPGGCAARAAPSPPGLLLAAAALTKQTGLAEGGRGDSPCCWPARAAGSPASPRSTEVAVLGISTLVLRLTSGGWYTYYVFKQMSEHSLTAATSAGSGRPC